jgi:hypothetical protein
LNNTLHTKHAGCTSHELGFCSCDIGYSSVVLVLVRVLTHFICVDVHYKPLMGSTAPVSLKPGHWWRWVVSIMLQQGTESVWAWWAEKYVCPHWKQDSYPLVMLLVA